MVTGIALILISIFKKVREEAGVLLHKEPWTRIQGPDSCLGSAHDRQIHLGPLSILRRI